MNSDLLIDLPKEIPFNFIPKTYNLSTLKLTNNKDYPISYKIKSTAPLNYVLSSTTGTISSNSSTDITITMQPMDFNPQNASMKDTFLIEAIPLPSNADSSSLSDSTYLKSLWKDVPKAQVQSSKLKVVLKSGASKSNIDSDESRAQNQESITDSVNSAQFQSMRGSEAHNLEEVGSGLLGMSFANKEIKGESPLIKSDTGFTEDLTQSGTWPGVSSESPKEKGNNESVRLSEEKVKGLEKRIEEMNKKMEEQRNLLFGVSQENTRLKSELSNLKSSAFVKEKANGDANNSNSYQLWHILVAIMSSLILGAFFGKN